MSKNRRPSSREHEDPAFAQAAQWLAKLDLGTLDEAEFGRWRADPRNALAFARTLGAAQAAAEVAAGESAASNQPHLSRRAAVAAGLGVLMLGGGVLVAGKVSARTRASTPVGGIKRVGLPRTGELILNTDTAASWRADRHGLSFWLERGEVALDLTSGGPVHLHGKRGAARLQPGRYNARLREDLLELTILHGEAIVDDAGGEQAIGKPSALLLGSGQPLIRPLSDQDVAETLAWRDGDILFLDEPLPAAVVEYNRHLVRKIIIADPRLKELHVGGRFDADDPAAFLLALETTMDIQVGASKNEIVLYRKPG